ncbi:DUF4817 domain-containing protein [Trichonephila clavipes]|nr:DUF4817 domain-containing protein [Trichonephila clavipes]
MYQVCRYNSSRDHVLGEGKNYRLHDISTLVGQKSVTVVQILNGWNREDDAARHTVPQLPSVSEYSHVVRLVYCQVIYSQFGLAIHQNDHQARRRFVEWARNEIAVVPDFHKRILYSDEAHFWLNGYVNKQNCRIWSEANPQVHVETPLHTEKLTVWCALWAGGIILQKR